MKKKLIPFTETEERFIKKVVDERSRVETRFPLIFGSFITFGFVSTLYGFEKIIDRIDLFANNPWILLVNGLLILFVTGAAYKKLN